MLEGAQTCSDIWLEIAKGRYIIFFDSDDYITPEPNVRFRCLLSDKYLEACTILQY